jgi:hypothetical protein
VQDPQILAVRIGGLLRDQGIVGHAEVARWEQLLPVAVVREGPRLADEPVDQVPVVDVMFVAAAQTWQTFDELLRVPHFQVFHEDTHLDALPDQPTRHRVTVAADVDQTARIDTHQETLACLQAAGRQGP